MVITKSMEREKQMTQKELEEQDERELYEELYNQGGEFTLPSD